jgi:hypothetical protein
MRFQSHGQPHRTIANIVTYDEWHFDASSQP